MRQKPGTRKSHGEKVVKDIRRTTRKQYSAEEKIRIMLDGLKGEEALPICVDVRALHRACITAGPRSSLKLGRSAWRATQPVQRRPPKSKTFVRNPVI